MRPVRQNPIHLTKATTVWYKSLMQLTVQRSTFATSDAVSSVWMSLWQTTQTTECLPPETWHARHTDKQRRFALWTLPGNECQRFYKHNLQHLERQFIYSLKTKFIYYFKHIFHFAHIRRLHLGIYVGILGQHVRHLASQIPSAALVAWCCYQCH